MNGDAEPGRAGDGNTTGSALDLKKERDVRIRRVLPNNREKLKVDFTES